MGISSLLSNVKSITKSGTHIGEHKNKTIAVDSYCWLHKCAYSCSRELVENCGNREAFVHGFLNRARLLKNSGVGEVVYVFDGASLPSKAREEQNRRQRREAAKDAARKAWSEGNRKLAFDCYGKALDVTFEMAKRVIDAIEREGLGRVLVAPFEADAQLAYLCKNGYADVVITEDSDLLAHGAPIIFYKMDNNGIGDEIRYEDLPRNRGLRFDQFTPDLFLQMCCMSGCDYLPSLPNVGMKKAHQAMRKCREYGAALRSFKFEGIRVDKAYENGFRDALITFKHALVYCPKRKKCVNLSDGGADGDEDTYEDVLNLRFSKEDEKRLLGERRTDLVCEGVANGKLHPVSLQPYPAQRELPKSSRNVTNANNNWMTIKRNSTNRTNIKDDEGSIIPRHQQPRAQYGARHTTTTTTTVTVPKRPIVRSNFFANALKDDEEERSKREALVRYASAPSMIDALEQSNTALLPVNRATPESSLQSPIKKRVVKKFDLYGDMAKYTPEDTKKKENKNNNKMESSPTVILNTVLRKSPRLSNIRSRLVDDNVVTDDKATPTTGKKSMDFLENFRFDSTSSKKMPSTRKTTVIPNTVSVGKKKKAMVSSLSKTTTTRTRTTNKKKRRTSKRLSTGGERVSASALFSEFALHSNTDNNEL